MWLTPQLRLLAILHPQTCEAYGVPGFGDWRVQGKTGLKLKRTPSEPWSKDGVGGMRTVKEEPRETPEWEEEAEGLHSIQPRFKNEDEYWILEGKEE